MKRFKLLSLFLILLLMILTACSGKNTEVSVESTDTSETTTAQVDGTQTSDGRAGMNDVSQLIFGTMMLDGTENAVTPDQAKTMLPLWQLYQTMVTEDTTASEELDAIINQIRSAFTEAQLTEMASFEYGNAMEMMNQLGLEPSATTEDGTEITIPQGGFDRSDMPQGGGDFAGGGPGGNGNGGAGMDMGGSDFGGMAGDGTGTEFDPQVMSTAQAENGGSFQNRQSLMFIPALIEYLQGIASS
jgi:PBP1b-binding outer membrane lipoprotein LpoB